MPWKVFWIVILFLNVPAYLVAEEMRQLDGCRFVPTEWADGDSFRVQSPDGEEITVRLYAVDCLEYHVSDRTDADRLREQRRYFGISEVGGSPEASMNLAKNVGRLAAEETARTLASPFTVHTAFADARGDGRYKRYYAFITTSEGEDLGERLVRLGYARAFGVYRARPDGTPRDVYREKLRDLELQAAKRGRGIWASTDWESLPDERQDQRDENAETEIATGRSKPNDTLDPNTAARDELMRLPGIGEIMANRIIEGRPYKSIDDLVKVDGLGAKTLDGIRDYLSIMIEKP